MMPKLHQSTAAEQFCLPRQNNSGAKYSAVPTTETEDVLKLTCFNEQMLLLAEIEESRDVKDWQVWPGEVLIESYDGMLALLMPCCRAFKSK